MKHVHSVQTEHSDRLLRLERRQEDDARMKSVWGTSSPFPGVLSGTPQQGPIHTPPTGEFPHLDEGQRHNILGNLQLDNDDEPKRGASRANSVRFDESAIHGHWGQVSRSSSDFFPRSGSGLGSHPLTERSTSHKSDGRHSSAGQSVHSTQSVRSTRTNSLGLDTSFSLAQDPATPFESPGPPPGLYYLGPVPSIIRCWLDENFSNDTLLYAVVCTGSYRSCIDFRLVSQLGLQESVARGENDEITIRLPVYLPEALVQKPSSRSNSPAPQLPSLTVTFTVIEQRINSRRRPIQVFLGSDTLKEHNADILLSQNSISLLGDDQSRLSVPLLRPEDESLFKYLSTKNCEPLDDSTTLPSQSQSFDSPGHFPAFAGNFTDPHKAHDEADSKISPEANSHRNGDHLRAESPSLMFPGSASPGVSVIGDKRRVDPRDASVLETEGSSRVEKGQEMPHPSEEKPDGRSREDRALLRSEDPGSATDSSSHADAPGGIWGSWRRESGLKGDIVSDSPTTASGYQRPGRGRGTKVLRPSKSSISAPSRSFSASRMDAGNESAPTIRIKDATEVPTPHEPSPRDSNRSTSGDIRSAPSASGTKSLRSMSSKSRAANPIGGASAFAWLNSGGRPQAETATSGD
ncbi:MAG: hypothetical protein M4579_001333 [Chaenotheca gracillima]|nr:MAG: hypothetical protein M4579_001333 [Chaenotheca gracillima]